MPALTPAQRQQKRRSRGASVSCVLIDPEAIRALRLAQAVHGGIPAALVAALRAWAAAQPAAAPPEPAPDTARRPRGGDRPGGAASAPDAGK